MDINHPTKVCWCLIEGATLRRPRDVRCYKHGIFFYKTSMFLYFPKKWGCIIKGAYLRAAGGGLHNKKGNGTPASSDAFCLSIIAMAPLNPPTWWEISFPPRRLLLGGDFYRRGSAKRISNCYLAPWLPFCYQFQGSLVRGIANKTSVESLCTHSIRRGEVERGRRKRGGRARGRLRWETIGVVSRILKGLHVDEVCF